MTEAEWISCADPQRMLRGLETGLRDHATDPFMSCGPREGKPSERKLRLWACACCRQAWDGVPCPDCGGPGIVPCQTCHGTRRVGGLIDPRSRRAVEVAEYYADGVATEYELRGAHYAAERAWEASGGETATNPRRGAAHDAWRCSDLSRPGLVVTAHRFSATPAAQAALLRCLFGNPWRTAKLPRTKADVIRQRQNAVAGGCCNRFADQRPCDCLKDAVDAVPWLRWNDGTVPAIARGIYENRRWQDMPILADALLDAGCDCEELLAHCRGQERCPNPGCREGHVCREYGYSGDYYHINCPVCSTKVSDGVWAVGNGWIPLRSPHARGCWAVDLILGLS